MAGVKIQRPDLPVEMLRKGSELDIQLSNAGNPEESRKRLGDLCPGYKPCTHEPGCYLCNSGEAGPTRMGTACTTCIVGQVTEKWVYIGPTSLTFREMYQSRFSQK